MNERVQAFLGLLGVVVLFLWVPVGATLWVVSFWRPDVRDISMWMLGTAGVLTTAGAITFMAQQVGPGAPPEEPTAYKKGDQP